MHELVFQPTNNINNLIETLKNSEQTICHQAANMLQQLQTELAHTQHQYKQLQQKLTQ